MINKLGDYIFKRIQKDNSDFRNIKYTPRESMTGLYISSKDIQRYVNDYFEYGIDYFGGDDFYQPEDFVEEKIDVYWDEGDGREE